MTVVVVLAIGWLVAALLTAGCAARIGWRNLEGFRRELRTEPLEVDEVLTDATPPRKLPHQPWPVARAVTEPRVAAAYRDYAHERRETAVLVGELVLVTSGAALGASLPGLAHGGWQLWPSALCLAAAATGVLIKREGEQRWTEVADSYEQRRAQLLAPPRRRKPRATPAAEG